jgi:PAS domain S-box-containing protein
MTSTNNYDKQFPIPDSLLVRWQRIVNLIARSVEAPICLIKRCDYSSTLVVVVNETANHDFYVQDNNYELNSGTYCDAVLQSNAMLEVADGRNDPVWQNNPELKQGLVAFLGAPLSLPDGEVFGTLCVLDNKAREFLHVHRDLLSEFKITIENDLALLAGSMVPSGISPSDDSKLWRAIQSAAMESILVMDTAGNFIDANEIGARRFGMSPSELLGKNLYKIVPPDVAESRKRKINGVIEQKRTMRFEDVRDDRFFDFTIYPVLDDSNQVEKLVVFAADITERRLTRRALERSERKYRDLVDEAATIIIRWDIHGNVTFFNEYAQAFFGYHEDEILGKNVVGTIVPETELTGRDLAHLMEEICRDPAKFEDNENENIKRNGERAWIAWKNRPIFDEHGELCEIHSVGIDITARKRAEDALRESEARWRSLTEHSPEHIMMLDKAGRIMFINHTVPDLTYEQVIGMPMASFLPPSYQKPTEKLLQQVWQSGEPDQYTVEYQSKDNMSRFFEANVSAVKDDEKITALIVSARDVTERRQVEEALRESEERQKKAQEVGKVGTWDWNPQTGELVWSDEIYRIIGYMPDEVIPSYELFLEHVHPHDREYLSSSVEKTLREKCPYNVDCRIVTRDGEEKIANAQGTARCDEHGTVVQMLGTFQDITERKTIEKELESYRSHLEELVAIRTAELESSNKELESYSYSIAHDLRSPLRAIIGFSQILKDEAQDRLEEEDIHVLKRIVAAGKNMAELIDDILELSRITRSELRYEDVDISRLGTAILSRLKQSLPERDVQWQVQGELLVRGDARLLEVALQNLIENAWKYTRNETCAFIELGKRKLNGKEVFFVSDNGVGFDMQYQKQLFKPFNRLHSPQEFEGTGIGLATVQRIVQRHGGKIWAESEAQNGATFYFTLHNFKTN